jgi:hypothetical protein
MKRSTLIVALVISVIAVSLGEGLDGLWIIRQNKSVVKVSQESEGYSFIKESYYRGDKEEREGRLSVRGNELVFRYQGGMTASGTLPDSHHIIENSVEDWVKVKSALDEEHFELTGKWQFLDSEVTLTQKGRTLSGKQIKNGSVVAEFSGFIDGRLISLQVTAQPKRLYPDYIELVIVDTATLLYSWGFTEDTYWTK